MINNETAGAASAHHAPDVQGADDPALAVSLAEAMLDSPCSTLGLESGMMGNVDLPMADDETFRRAARLVETLAAQHGLNAVQLGQHGGELVVTAGADRDYFDLMRFEMELESLLRARVRVVSSGAPGVRPRGPMRQGDAAA